MWINQDVDLPQELVTAQYQRVAFVNEVGHRANGGIVQGVRRLDASQQDIGVDENAH